ncbi:lipid-A-disaccharide synthase [Fodinicurvata sp. EGI_FJ10296]|uniref:lipid-A-disaccharide synthase n=1 Tax=Fodinicurvata sp. EGI_FJ10296 TaxID=3231908 RepID=UPI003451C378
MTANPEQRPLTILMIAGEESGDLLGGRLIRALRESSARPVRILGVGGSSMVTEGLESLFPMEDLTAFGLSEVLPKIPTILRRMRQTAAAAVELQPDAMVLIDAPGFNMRLAERLRHRSFPLIQYVAPTVWAWKPGRAKRLARSVDEVLCLFPFEPSWFIRHGLAATDVGHSVVESGANLGDGPAFRREHGVDPQTSLLCMLPGSRRGEIERLLPIFGDTAEQLARNRPGLRVVLPTLPALEQTIREAVAGWPTRPIVIAGKTEKYDAFASSNAAIAASGTVALELAMAGTPHIVAYRVSPPTAWIARRLLTTKYANLVNILFDEAVIPEFIQQDCTVANLTGAIGPLLEGGTEASVQIRRLAEARAMFGSSTIPPSLRAAQAILRRVDQAAAGS